MKKFWIQYWVMILVLMVIAAFLCISVNNNSRKSRLPTETVVAWFLDSYKEDGEIYIEVQRVGSNGREPWIISKKNFEKLTDDTRYEFKITGYPGGISVLDVNTTN